MTARQRTYAANRSARRWDRNARGRVEIDPPIGHVASSPVAPQSLHVSWIDLVPLDEAPERAAILLRRASGLRDVALMGAQRLADELPFEIIDETCACGAEPDGLDCMRG